MFLAANIHGMEQALTYPEAKYGKVACTASPSMVNVPDG